MELASVSSFRSNSVMMMKKSPAIIHVRENSLDELEALFDRSKWPKRPVPPLHKRNLPASFFRPPPRLNRPSYLAHISHLRQSSMDHSMSVAGKQASQQAVGVKIEPTPVASNSAPLHLRSASEPVAMLDVTPVTPGNLTSVSNNGMTVGSNSGLPYGWQQATTVDGKIYYANNITKQSSWQPPSDFTGIGSQQVNMSSEGLLSSSSSSAASSTRSSFDVSMINTPPIDYILARIPMPAGWEQARTSRGEIYFINHNNCTTCWDDPRLPLVPSYLARWRAESGQFSPAPNVISAAVNEIEQIKSTLIETRIKRTELLQSLEEANKQESYLCQQLSMAETGMTPPSSSSSSCDVADLNTADVDLTYLDVGNLDCNNHLPASHPSNDRPKPAKTETTQSSDADDDTSDDDLSSLDLNSLDTVPVSSNSNQDDLSTTLINNSNVFDHRQQQPFVKTERSTDLEQVNDLYTKMLINNSMTSVGVDSNSSPAKMRPREVQQSGSCLKRPLSDANLDDTVGDVGSNISHPNFKESVIYDTSPALSTASSCMSSSPASSNGSTTPAYSHQMHPQKHHLAKNETVGQIHVLQSQPRWS